MAPKGLCAICTKAGKLTTDHVPPQLVVPPERILIERFARELGERSEGDTSRPGFASLEFPTICETCNTRRLGQLYDPALARFSNDFGTWVRAGFQLHLSLPPVASIELQPALVARAIVGHLLAAEADRSFRTQVLDGTLPSAMREYFMSSDLRMPFRLFVWPHPSDRIVVGRGLGHYDLRGGDPIFADTLKFFPVAFAVVENEKTMPRISAVEIRPELVDDLSGAMRLDIPLHQTPGLTWPEQPQKASIVLMDTARVLTARRVAPDAS